MTYRPTLTPRASAVSMSGVDWGFFPLGEPASGTVVSMLVCRCARREPANAELSTSRSPAGRPHRLHSAQCQGSSRALPRSPNGLAHWVEGLGSLPADFSVHDE